MKKLARIAVLFLTVAGTLVTHVQPASATEAGAIAFLGTSDVGPDIGYPCTPVGVPPNSKCPPTGFGPNSAAVDSFNSTVCVGAAVAVNKGSKPPVSGPLCGYSSTGGSIHGYCGLSQGTLHGTLTISGFVGGKSYSFSLTFTEVGVTVLSGSITNHATGGTGTIFGVMNMAPTGGSCTNKDAKTFTWTGTAVFVRV